MKETKKTPVPLPGSKSKSKSKEKSVPKPDLSREFISDDSSADDTPQPKAAAKPKATIGVHRPNGVEKSTTKTKAKSDATSKSATKTKPTPKKPEPKKIATQQQAEELSSSEQSDDSDAPARDIQTKLPGNEKKMQDASSSSSSESDSGSDDSSDSSSDDEAETATQKRAQEQTRTTQQKSHAVEMRAAQPYVPPKGYNPVPLNERTTSKATSIFDNLQGKQVWHITAPAGVSLKDLQEIAMDAAMEGETIMKYKNTDYCFGKTEKSEDGAREVLVPQKNGYKAVPTRISRTFHLQQAVQLPALSSKQANPKTGSEAAASITRSTIRAPRPQVKGLRMRFLPTGFGGGEGGILGDSDSEDEVPQERAGLAMPKGLNLPSKAEKRKHADVNMEDAPAKKSKKHRTPEEIKKREEKKAKKEKKAKS